MVIGRHAGVYQQVQGRMYAVKLQIGEGQGVKGRQDRMGVLGHESQSRKPSKEIQNGGPVLFLRAHTKCLVIQ